MWQTLRERLHPKGLEVVTVALDVDEDAARPFIEEAHPTHPSLIDHAHVSDELFGFVNVPNAVWIDENGKIVRPTEPAGVTDGFRTMDRKTFAMPQNAIDELTAKRTAYQNALHDWADRGSQSRFALSEAEVLRRMHTPDDDRVRAAANFRLGQLLNETGRAAAAVKYLDEAHRLRPESWNYRRQALSLKDPTNPLAAGGPEFWDAVDALGKEKYYPAAEDI